MSRRRLKVSFGIALLLSLAYTPAWARGTCSVQLDSVRQTAHIQILDQVPSYRESVQDGWTSLMVDAFQQTTLQESDQPELPCLEYWISVPRDAKVIGLDVQSPQGHNVSYT